MVFDSEQPVALANTRSVVAMLLIDRLWYCYHAVRVSVTSAQNVRFLFCAANAGHLVSGILSATGAAAL
jgi:hypothetical protein